MIAGDGRQVIVVETRRRAVLDIGARRNDGT
jgi:hypothetical protein